MQAVNQKSEEVDYYNWNRLIFDFKLVSVTLSLSTKALFSKRLGKYLLYSYNEFVCMFGALLNLKAL